MSGGSGPAHQTPMTTAPGKAPRGVGGALRSIPGQPSQRVRAAHALPQKYAVQSCARAGRVGARHGADPAEDGPGLAAGLCLEGGGGAGRVPSEEPCGWRWVLLSCP